MDDKLPDLQLYIFVGTFTFRLAWKNIPRLYRLFRGNNNRLNNNVENNNLENNYNNYGNDDYNNNYNHQNERFMIPNQIQYITNKTSKTTLINTALLMLVCTSIKPLPNDYCNTNLSLIIPGLLGARMYDVIFED